MSEKTVSVMESTDGQGNKLKVTLEGHTNLPFWEHDLKLEAVKMLLNTVDRKDFNQNGIYEEFEQYMEDIQELLNAVRES